MKGQKLLASFIVLALLLSVGMVAVVSLAQENAASVIIRNNAFNPASITVPQGTTGTWTNRDNVTHTVFSTLFGPDAEPIFPSGPIAPGSSYSFTFDQFGTYDYYDTIYPHMTGTVTVTSGTALSNQTTANQTEGGIMTTGTWTHMAVAHLDTRNAPGVGNATNSTHAEGMALFWADQNTSQMNYALFVSDATNITMAHIDEWSNGTLGPIVVWLYPGNTPTTSTPVAINGVSNGIIVVGSFTAADLVGSLQNKSLSDLISQMNDNNTFANWHSTEYPSAYMIGNITTNLSSPASTLVMKELNPQYTL